MGRSPSVPQVTRNGTYKCWHPGIKKYVNLGTSDYAQALAIQAGFYGKAPERNPAVYREATYPVPAPVGDPAIPYPESSRSNQGAAVIDFDKADDPLSGWLNKDKTNEPASIKVEGQTGTPSATNGPGQTLPWLPQVAGKPVTNKAKPGLTHDGRLLARTPGH